MYRQKFGVVPMNRLVPDPDLVYFVHIVISILPPFMSIKMCPNSDIMIVRSNHPFDRNPQLKFNFRLKHLEEDGKLQHQAEHEYIISVFGVNKF